MSRRKEPDDYKYRIGERYGKLVIVDIVGRNENDRIVAKCQCDCGNFHYPELHSLVANKLGSCGCSRQSYKGISLRSQERLYTIWHGIRSRCYNPNELNYHNYGGRGITMCEEWKNDYKAFREWSLNNGYSDDLTIDRIDVDGNYCPNNCKWATWVEQCNNKRGNVKITYKGQTHTATEWSKITGISAQRITHRFRRNFPLDIVFSPKRLASRGNYVQEERDNSNRTVTEKE